MKSIKIVFLTLFCIVLLATCIFAHESTTNDSIFYPNENITIVFEDPSSLDYEKQQFIANAIVYGSPVQSRAWCWLTGHSYIENNVSAITHKVSDIEPRCWEDFYIITTCEKCDYYEEELIGSGMIFCCPVE